jgi:hypothetical protein
VVAAYQRAVEGEPLEEGAPGGPSPSAEIREIALLDAGGTPVHHAVTGAALRVRVPFTALHELRAPRFEVSFYGFQDGALHTRCEGGGEVREGVGAGEGRAEFEIPALGLAPGVYTLGATITEAGAARPCAWLYGRATLYVEEGPRVPGRFFMPSRFTLVSAAPRTGSAAGSPTR